MPTTPVQRRKFPWLTTAWLGYWGLLFIVMHIPVPKKTIPKLHVSDKTLHFVVYFLLVLLGGIVLRHRVRRGSKRGDESKLGVSRSWWRESAIRQLALWAVIYSLYGAFEEWSQQFVHRSTSLEDWYADVLGILAATVLLIGWSLWRQAEERRRA